jgi:hypothetical protein
MELYDVVTKLIGNINPVGMSEVDSERLENLKVMTELVEKLITDIDNVDYRNKDSHEYSVKKAADFASDFLSNKIGIKE